MSDAFTITVPALNHDGGVVHMGQVQRGLNDLARQTSTALNSIATGGAIPSGPAGGGLSGTYPNPVVSSASAGFAVTGMLTASGQFLSTYSTAPSGLNSNFLAQAVTTGTPSYGWNQTAAGLDQKIYSVFSNSAGILQFNLVNDANNNANTWLAVSRSGFVCSGIASNSGSGAWAHTGTFNATTVQSGGVTLSPTLAGTSASIGGSALVAGQTATTTVTVTGATTAMVALCSPVTYPGAAFTWDAYVSAPNTVTVVLQATVAGTPAASAYNVRVLQ